MPSFPVKLRLCLKCPGNVCFLSVFVIFHGVVSLSILLHAALCLQPGLQIFPTSFSHACLPNKASWPLKPGILLLSFLSLPFPAPCLPHGQEVGLLRKEESWRGSHLSGSDPRFAQWHQTPSRASAPIHLPGARESNMCCLCGLITLFLHDLAPLGQP